MNTNNWTIGRWGYQHCYFLDGKYPRETWLSICGYDHLEKELTNIQFSNPVDITFCEKCLEVVHNTGRPIDKIIEFIPTEDGYGLVLELRKNDEYLPDNIFTMLVLLNKKKLYMSVKKEKNEAG